MPDRSRVLCFIAAAAALGSLYVNYSCTRGPELPRVLVEEAVYDFQDRFGNDAKIETAAAVPPSPTMLFVGTKKTQLKEGGNRPALDVPPPASVSYELPALPRADCVLRFSLGLGFDASKRPTPVQYRVLLDGNPAYSGSLSRGPNGEPVDWQDVEIPLSYWKGKPVKVTFQTDCAPGDATTDKDKQIVAGYAIPLVVKQTPKRRLPEGHGHWNVLVALVDTTRADHVSCYGYGRKTTPHLDKLAALGVRYSNAISQASWTWPATASVLTSLYPHAHGVLGPDSCYLVDSIKTIGERLQEEGYTTYGISANALICRAQNFNQGFETFDEAFHEPADVVTDHFLSWLGKNEGRAFFAYLHYMDPHHPYTPPETARQEVAPEMFEEKDRPAIERIMAGQADMRSVQRLEPDKDHLVALYDAEIRNWDDHFARAIDALRAKGLLDRTIVVVTADHGEEFWDHGHCGHAKTLYQELIRVPLVVFCPKLAKPRAVDTLVETIDIYPTICAALGIAPPKTIDGLRLPGLSGVEPPERTRPECYSTTELSWKESDNPEMDLLEQEAIVTPSLKLIRQQTSSEKPDDRRDLLFDLPADPGEKHNLAEEKKELLPPLVARVAAWLAETRGRAVSNGRPWLRESIAQALGKLGYMGGGAPKSPGGGGATGPAKDELPDGARELRPGNWEIPPAVKDWLGAHASEILEDAGFEEFEGLDTRGLKIAAPERDSILLKLGFRKGDVVTALNSDRITSLDTLRGYFERVWPRIQVLRIDYVRAGKLELATYRLLDATEGAVSRALFDDVALESFAERAVAGVKVGPLVDHSPAAQNGFKTGDVITKINGQPMTTASDVRTYFAALVGDEPKLVRVDYYREQEKRSLTFHVQ